MEKPNKIETSQAIAVLDSIITRCERAQLKLNVATSQHSLLVHRIKAMKICKDLLSKKPILNVYSVQEIEAALIAVVSSLHKCQKAQSKQRCDSFTYQRLQPMIDTLDSARICLTEIKNRSS